MMYLITVLSILSGTILVILCKPLILKHKNSKSLLSRRSKSILIVLLLICIAGAIFAQSKMNTTNKPSTGNEQAQKALNDKRTSAPANKATASLPAYEIVSSPEKNNDKRVVVYTTSKNRDQLVLLQKKLGDLYKKSPTSSLSFDYFDSKLVAAIYFFSAEDARTTDIQRKELFKHYIATGGSKITNADNFLMLGSVTEITRQLSLPVKPDKSGTKK
jgi:hypothetical protein